MSETLKNWLRNNKAPWAQKTFVWLKSMRGFALPVVPVLHKTLFELHIGIANMLAAVGRVFWFIPLFQTRLTREAKNLYLYGGMPQILGNLQLTIGDDCRISGQTTFTARPSSTNPSLTIGNNVDIGWQTTIAVGTRVEIGHNVRIAGRAFLAGYPGHPVNPKDRAAGLPDTEDQIGDIVLEKDVWLATGVTVLAGVTIGAGTIVAAGSVVTKDLPAGVMAAGVPAVIIRQIEGAA